MVKKTGDQGKEISRKEAVALKYDPDIMEAPQVVAKGRGYVAEKIIEEANEHKIPVHEDPALASALVQLNLGDVIPPELYQVVAEVLAFIMSIDRKYG